MTQAARSVGVLLEPGTIGPIEVRNRIVRAATSESAARPSGEVSDELIAILEELARGGIGLVMTGHMFVAARGRYGRGQAGIHDDSMIGGLRNLTTAVHRHGGRIFAQLAHAGSQSMVRDVNALAPSLIPNIMTGRRAKAATVDEIMDTVAAFASAARRAAEADFDGVQIHAANGYLISEFRSPVTNQRDDEWGGSLERRERFPIEVVRAVRSELPASMAVSMKVGVEDLVSDDHRLAIAEAIAGVRAAVSAGLDAVEVSSNVISDYPGGSIVPYVAVGSRRAVRDLLLHRLLKPPGPEAYFLPYAREVRKVCNTKVILVGGLRRVATMEDIIRRGDADFVALSRPLIREPHLVRKIESGWRGQVACTSCNICSVHEGRSLRCWRQPRRRLIEHAVLRIAKAAKRKSAAPNWDEVA